MVINVNETKLRTISQLQDFLQATPQVSFSGVDKNDDDGRYRCASQATTGPPDTGHSWLSVSDTPAPQPARAIDCSGHVAECHERFLTGVELERRKAACRERLQRV
jgi:hypothetical protein